jgi:hypothetical protein
VKNRAKTKMEKEKNNQQKTLAVAIESYIVAMKRSFDSVSKKADIPANLVDRECEALVAMQSIFYKTSEEEITQLFADLYDYWDTLGVGRMETSEKDYNLNSERGEW